MRGRKVKQSVEVLPSDVDEEHEPADDNPPCPIKQTPAKSAGVHGRKVKQSVEVLPSDVDEEHEPADDKTDTPRPKKSVS